VFTNVGAPSVHLVPAQEELAQSPALMQDCPSIFPPHVALYVAPVPAFAQSVPHVHPSGSEHFEMHESDGDLVPSVHVPLGQCALAHSLAIAQVFPSIFPPHVCVLVIVVCAQSVEQAHPSSSAHVIVQVARSFLIPSVHVPLGQCALAQSPSTAHVAASLFFPQV